MTFINCQFCLYRIKLRGDIPMSHQAMRIAAHIMTEHTGIPSGDDE